MRKLWAFMFFSLLFVTVTGAQAKVCFLPGVLSNDGCLTAEEDLNRCSGYTRTSPCLSGCDQSTCVTGGVTYYNCVCRNDNIKDIGDDYICLEPFDPSCGCGTEDTICNKSKYPYQGCAKYPGTVPSSEFCKSPKDGKVWYKSCTCPPGVYPYDCKKNGLKKPGTASKCETPGGEVKYSFCLCDDNWSTTPCANRADGCTSMVDHVFNGLDTCYYCGEEMCPIRTQINLEQYWCSISQTTKTDCAQLGYSYAPSGKCDDGSTGLKCPFDDDYMFCASGGSTLACDYDDKVSCETDNPAFICLQNSAKCYIPSGCASGYVQAENRLLYSHVYTSFTAGGLTCYKPSGCASSFVTESASGCIEFNSAGFKCYGCAIEGDLCPVTSPSSINDCGTSGALGWTLEKDSNGCNICKPKICDPDFREEDCPGFVSGINPPDSKPTLIMSCYNGDVKKCRKSTVDPVEPNCCEKGFDCECSGKCSNTCDPFTCAICWKPAETI